MVKESKYPYIGRSCNNGAKVLFIAPSTGYMLQNDRLREAGYYAENWNDSVFQPINKWILGDNHAL